MHPRIPVSPHSLSVTPFVFRAFYESTHTHTHISESALFYFNLLSADDNHLGKLRQLRRPVGRAAVRGTSVQGVAGLHAVIVWQRTRPEGGAPPLRRLHVAQMLPGC